ncbi:MAG: glycoside hydrolase [Candidatus Sumerlaeaceae bacterium]|nr:glycoside hydrolase [Candidatus Sumerlaeaceae bacterium]
MKLLQRKWLLWAGGVLLTTVLLGAVLISNAPRGQTCPFLVISDGSPDYPIYSSNGSLTYGNGTWIVVWPAGNSTTHSRHGAVLCCRSTDQGKTWSNPNLICNSGPLWKTETAVSFGGGEHFVATWVSTDDTAGYHVFASTSADAGITWSQPQDVTIVQTKIPSNYYGIELLGDRNGRFLLFMQNTPYGQLSCRSVDHGKTWSKPMLLDSLVFPRGYYWEWAVSGNGTILAASTNLKFVVQSNNMGSTWTTTKLLADPPAYDKGMPPVFCGNESWTIPVRVPTKSGNTDDTELNVTALSSSDNGTTWKFNPASSTSGYKLSSPISSWYKVKSDLKGTFVACGMIGTPANGNRGVVVSACTSDSGRSWSKETRLRETPMRDRTVNLLVDLEERYATNNGNTLPIFERSTNGDSLLGFETDGTGTWIMLVSTIEGKLCIVRSIDNGRTWDSKL